jgi:ATP-dependent Lon protease
MSNSKPNNTAAKKSDIVSVIEKKVDFFKNVVQKTILHAQRLKSLGILTMSDVNICVDKLQEQSKKITDLEDLTKAGIEPQDSLINLLQSINNEVSCIFKIFGTASFDDFLVVCFGNSSHKVTDESVESLAKLELLCKYFHPISYRMVNPLANNRKTEDEIVIDEKSKSLTGFELNHKSFHLRVHGLKLFVLNQVSKKGLIVNGIIDNVVLNFLNHKYVLERKSHLLEFKPREEEFAKPIFKNFIDSLSLRDYFAQENTEIYGKFAGYLLQINTLQGKNISQNVKEFMNEDLYTKRLTLLQLLVDTDNYENQYLAYLLYDLLSNDSNGTVDTEEQTTLLDSLPWQMKQNFRNAMKKTIQYTNELSSFDINKIPLEQQICLLKTTDHVKEKAMVKLKEVKAKSEDSGAKARQYLDGLLKIPFGVYKKEPCLTLMDTVRQQYIQMIKTHQLLEVPNKENITSLEIVQAIKTIEQRFTTFSLENLKTVLLSGDKTLLLQKAKQVNDFLRTTHPTVALLGLERKKKEELKDAINLFITNNPSLHNGLAQMFLSPSSPTNANAKLFHDLNEVKTNLKKISEYMKDVKDILDKSVYSHEGPKRQLERIIGQWVHGKNEGYCLGVCGPPGVGKTSIIKEALSNCLKDERGVNRPFHMIQLGGDSNGSSLIGHSYTYVGSTWGSIVQIIIDSKCMNPIIFIDEVDKVSKTEHGKEIIGILTHLLDPAQNDVFQDKYFTGVELDLSKALFVLSYNDESLIDRILLDRIHRIKFDGLSLEDKIVIAKRYVLPEIYSKMGLTDVIEFPKEVLKFIINEYTCEAGVRKMTQVLTEIVGEINLSVLKNNDMNFSLPILITEEDIKTKYFKDKVVPIKYKIHSESRVGVINALWANQMKQGGVLPLQISFVPASKFLDLTLTGSLGEVMKESISVSLTNAWNLTPKDRQLVLLEKYNNSKQQQVFGLHIHCPSISTPKDGPSATTAFTVAIYSLLNERKIKNYFGITGETSFDFVLTQIGGLEEKIIHSIPAGITEFIFPRENQADFDRMLEKYRGNEILDGIKFHSIERIEDVLDKILE